MSLTSVRRKIIQTMGSIRPVDALERVHLADAIDWVRSCQPIYRVEKPDLPKKHLVSYFLLFDPQCGKVLLVDHKKAGLWLPTGGHVEVDEDPSDTVKRECLEELGIRANFLWPSPLFLTSTLTVGETAGHTDVSLWYVLKGCSRQIMAYDSQEFHQVQWFRLEDIPLQRTDPHMGRLIRKLKTQLLESALRL